MSELWVLAPFGLGAAAMIGYVLLQFFRPLATRVADDVVWEAVRSLRLEVPFDRLWPATGKVDGVALEVKVVAPSGDPEAHAHRRLVVTLVHPAPAPIRLGLGLDWLGAETLVVGEGRFDELLHLQTQHALEARAILDAPTRDAIALATALGGRFDGERWELVTDATTWTPSQVVKAIRTLLRAHHALKARTALVRADPKAALNAVARGDRSAGVRSRSLEHLLHAGIAERDTLTDRVEDVDVGVRLLAANALGPEGHPVLEHLARTGSRSVRVRAATLLAGSRSLGAARQALAEDTFLAALDDPDLATQALLGLTRIGTARAVPALRACTTEAPTAPVRKMAEGVLATIRARLDPAASGGVSLTEGAGGEVAIAESAVNGRLAPVAERQGP